MKKSVAQHTDVSGGWVTPYCLTFFLSISVFFVTVDMHYFHNWWAWEQQKQTSKPKEPLHIHSVNPAPSHSSHPTGFL